MAVRYKIYSNTTINKVILNKMSMLVQWLGKYTPFGLSWIDVYFFNANYIFLVVV